MTSPIIFDRHVLRRNWAKASTGFHRYDFLYRHAAQEIGSRLEAIQRSFAVGIDIEARTDVLPASLAARFPGIELIPLVSVSPLELRLPRPHVIGDPEALPFAGGSIDLAVSALALHLVNDLPGTLIQIRRALRPDGLFLAALLGGDTLIELRHAFMLAETETAGGVTPRIFPTADVRDTGALLQRAGFALPVVDSEMLTVTYESPLALMRELKGMGGSNPLASRSRKTLRKDTLAKVTEIYRERFSEANGRVRATFEIIYLSGWAPHESQQKPLKPGSAAHRLADALGTVEIAAGDKASFGRED